MIPRRVLVLWNEKRKPLIVQRCTENIRRMCSTCEVHVLTFDEALAILGTQLPSFYAQEVVQIQADWIRAHWMREFGGIYIDASCVLTCPIESWLTFETQDLVAFEAPENEDVCEIWFLASSPNHPIIESWTLNLQGMENCGHREFLKQCSKLPKPMRHKYHMCGAALHKARHGKDHVLLPSFPQGPLQFLGEEEFDFLDVPRLLGYSLDTLRSMRLVKLNGEHRRFVQSHGNMLRRSELFAFIDSQARPPLQSQQ
jgi:hypothetical protein